MDASYPPHDGRLSYGRNGTPTQWALAEALTELEPGAVGTRLFPSGSAAVAMALSSALEPGDELLMVDSVYQPTRMFCDQLLKRHGIGTRYYDPLATSDQIEALLSDSTRAIFMESPGSLTFEVRTCLHLRDGAPSRHCTLLAIPGRRLCSSSAVPGVDLSIVACTKYVSGHGDVMLGSVTAAEPAWDKLSKTARLYGQYVSPDDAYLAARGLRTMGVRLRRHEDSAIKIARWLDEQPRVAGVLHPAFKDCPGHAYWKRDFHRLVGGVLVRPGRADDAAPTASSRASRCSHRLQLGASKPRDFRFHTRTGPRHPPRQAAGTLMPPAHRPRGSRPSPPTSRKGSTSRLTGEPCPWQSLTLRASGCSPMAEHKLPKLTTRFDSLHPLHATAVRGQPSIERPSIREGHSTLPNPSPSRSSAGRNAVVNLDVRH